MKKFLLCLLFLNSASSLLAQTINCAEAQQCLNNPCSNPRAGSCIWQCVNDTCTCSGPAC